jgi:hypothetical protein
MVPPRLLKVVGGVLASALIAQLVLGWGLGLVDAWVPILLGAAILAVLVFVDAGEPERPATDQSYDLGRCAVVALAIGGAVACLYLPLPWGGLGSAAILVVVVALGLADHRA